VRERNQFEDLGINGRMNIRTGLEPSVSVKCGEFFDWLRNY
jgi:hypothetical protein